MENLKPAEEVDNESIDTPVEAVVAEADTGTPQPDVEEQEFEVDLGTDEQTSDTVPLHNHLKLRNKFKAARGEAKEKDSENENLRAEVEKLRSEVTKVTRGPRPEPFDFNTTDEFYAELDRWQGLSAPPVAAKAPAAQQQAPNVFALSDSVVESHYENATKLPVKDYEAAESTVREELEKAFPGAGNTLTDYVIANSGDKSHLNIYALGKGKQRLNTLIGKINADKNQGTNSTLEYVFDLKKKVDIKPKKTVISTNPEEIPEGSGNADALNTQINQAYDKWASEPTIANSKSLQKLRNKQNG